MYAQEFKDFYMQLAQNNSQLALNKFGQNLLFPNSSECATRRDYIIHRLGASSQQLMILKQVIENQASSYLSAKVNTGKMLEYTFNAINQVSYCFDNLIFNLASLSDYFGNYLGLYLFGQEFQNLKWNGFVLKTKEMYANHQFQQTVTHEDNNWFDKLHGYRGDIIHRKAILVEVDGFENKRVFPHTVEKLKFTINTSLKKHFHILRKSESNDLLKCAEMISLRTINGLSCMLESSESIEFDASYKNFSL